MPPCDPCLVRQRAVRALSAVRRPGYAYHPTRRQQDLRLATTATQHGHEQLRQDIQHSAERPFGSKIGVWLRLLDSCVPAHLRDPGSLAEHAKIPNARDIGRILYDAGDIRATRAHGSKPKDLLTHLGLREGRWPTVMWLIKSVVEDPPSPTAQLAQDGYKGSWVHTGPLSEITTDPINMELDQLEPSNDSGRSPLDNSPDLMAADTFTQDRHKALGRIWLSLGNMILSNEGHVVKPEILEIIAYLHHRGIIPASIYSRKPRTDITAIQQPPTLYLLSSRILVSLSDAAWRAHEKLVVEEAKSKGGKYAALRPEIPGTAFRVHVEGLSREIWIELVLWSCLHGGWIQAGATILLKICQTTKPRWKPLAWRSFHHVDMTDFDSINHIVHTRAAAFEEVGKSGQDVRDTVSSEVVNAYVDALLSGLDSLGTEQRMESAWVINALHHFREFLERSELRLTGGSWDAVVARLVESRGTQELSLEMIAHLIKLSPGFGAEINTVGAQGLPSYVLDGNASVLGLAHRALHHQVLRGDLEAAVKVLRLLRDYTDSNKHESLRDFFTTIRDNKGSSNVSSLFTCNYAPIDYPSFNTQIPSTTLGPLLELATISGDVEVAKWMLHDQAIDGPLIPESSYADPAIVPALIRFATRTSDRQLLSKVVSSTAKYNAGSRAGPAMPEGVIQAFLDTQIDLRRWEAVTRILEFMRDRKSLTWNTVNLAHLGRCILHIPSDDPERGQAMSIFTQIISSTYDSRGKTVRQPPKSERLILLTMLASVDPTWLTVLPSITDLPKFADFDTSARAFNVILDGVIATQGAMAGRRLLQLFWPQATRREVDDLYGETEQHSQQGDLGLKLELLSKSGRQRIKLTRPGPPQKDFVIQGGVRPDIATIRMIYRRALEKSQAQDGARSCAESKSTSKKSVGRVSDMGVDIHEVLDEMTIWAIRALWALGASRRATNHQIDAMMSEYGQASLKDRLPSLMLRAADLRDSDIIVDDIADEEEEVDAEMSENTEED